MKNIAAIITSTSNTTTTLSTCTYSQRALNRVQTLTQQKQSNESMPLCLNYRKSLNKSQVLNASQGSDQIVLELEARP